MPRETRLPFTFAASEVLEVKVTGYCTQCFNEPQAFTISQSFHRPSLISRLLFLNSCLKVEFEVLKLEQSMPEPLSRLIQEY